MCFCQLGIPFVASEKGKRSHVGVAEVTVSLCRIFDTCGRESERVDSPGEVFIPVNFTQRQAFADSWLIDLDSEDTSGLEVDNFVTKGESKLFGLELLGDVCSGERPVKDGDGSSELQKGKSKHTCK